MQFALWFATAAFVALLWLGPWIVELWTGGRIAVRQPLFGWLLAAGVATQLWTSAACALHATNRSQAIAAIYVLVSGAALAVAAIAGTHAGSDGVAAVLAVAEFVVFALILRRTLAFLGQRFSDVLRDVLRPPRDALDLLRRGS